VRGQAGTLPGVRPPTWIEHGRLLAGRHPCAWSPDYAEAEVTGLLGQGVTLFLDLTQPNELVPYDGLVPASARHVRLPVQDFTVPSEAQILTALDTIDAELGAGGVVYVHCWAGCGRTGVVVGCRRRRSSGLRGYAGSGVRRRSSSVSPCSAGKRVARARSLGVVPLPGERGELTSLR